MTANIPQHVIRRRNPISIGKFQLLKSRVPGRWQRDWSRQSANRPSRISTITQSVRYHSQRGSIDQSAVALGLAVVVLVGVSLLGFVYLQQVLGTASQGASIQDLEAEIATLREQQRELELEGAELRSIKAIENNVEGRELRAESDAVAFLTPVHDRVAQR